MPTKICKAIATETNGTIVFSPDDGAEIPTPVVIARDASGVHWYWRLTPEDIEAERVASEAAAKAYREATA